MTHQPTPPNLQQPDHADARASAKAAKAYAKATRPWYRKKRWWLLAAVVLLIIVAATSSGGEGGGSGATKVGSDDSTSKSSEDKKVETFKVGDTVLLEGTQYTVEEARSAAEAGGEFTREKADGIFVIVTLTLENKKDETKTFSESAANLVGGNGKKYAVDDDAWIVVDDPLILEDMQPDLPKTGTLIFDIPKDAAKGSKLEVSDLFGGGEAYIDLGL